MSSNKPSRVLVVDADKDRARRLSNLLDFIDYSSDIAHDQASLASRVDLTEFLAIFLVHNGETIDLAKQLHHDIESCPPLVLFADDIGIAGVDASALDEIFLSVSKFDIRYSELTNILHKAELLVKHGGGVAQSLELFRSLVGNSRPIKDVRRMIEQVAPTEATVLVLGESGTGKEVVARNIHYYSKRRNKPFVPINCGAIPPDLLESELFGHEKGAFSGAISTRQGRFELAEGGTIFLDEIGDMPLNMQVKLLRVLQEKSFERVGSSRSMKTNVRIIAATHRNLEEMIAENTFREDLYYRLNVFPIEMPKLKDRAEDLPLLVNELITRLEHEKGGSVRLTPAAVMALCNYHWPGNVRELANLMERLAILFPHGVVDVKDLPAKVAPNRPIGDEDAPLPQVDIAGMPNMSMLNEPRLPREGIDLKKHLTDIEIALIRQALDECHGVVAHAAKRLRVRRTTLVEKMRKYGIARPEEAS